MGDGLSEFSALWRGPVPPTPFYAYSEQQLADLWSGLARATPAERLAVPFRLHFAMKSNANPHVLQHFAARGAGVDLVSGGELDLALRTGFAPRDMVFSGVGKTNDELRLAVERDVGLINCESRGEVERLAAVARAAGKTARISLRVNPDVDARTHPYISTGLSEHKFGVSMNEGWEIYRLAAAQRELRVSGLSVHIGSQLMHLDVLGEALDKTLDFARKLKGAGIGVNTLDMGGGLGVDYQHPLRLPPFEVYGQTAARAAREWLELQGPGSQMISECGRAVVAQAGFLVTRVIGLKQNGNKKFAIVDASMSELMRPSLYQAWHPIDFWGDARSRTRATYDVVGPVCESADVLGLGRELPELKEGDLLVIGCAGAYGYVMASHYNARPLPAEWWMPKTGPAIISRPARAPWL
ncbi:MAG: diaminopimelate decarboxylase [Bdellovibrionales bacterium]|nr:diaminopimelate decarboxylase [Bdellovibrionales bacterium]